jgi:DNA-binding GntR family transcriptional regulator
VFGKNELLTQLDDQQEMFAALEAHDSQRARNIMETHILNFSNQVKNHLFEERNSA